MLWWLVLCILIIVHISCTMKGIQPNPLYRVVNKRISVTRTIPRRVGTLSSTFALVLGLIFGGLVYWTCLYVCCPKC